jgi:bifunctional UDP-N-acetylglucosamine pyrophosphorylase/glucosamine-1-phosphate N-acetyltransferase
VERDVRRLLIIPAAGIGSRLGVDIPKVLVRVGGQPMLGRLLELYGPFVQQVAVVVRPEAVDQVRPLLDGCRIPASVVIQASPTGMLDAILLARECVTAATPDRVWITWCDQVAVHRETLERLVAIESEVVAPALVMPTHVSRNPYIHFARGLDRRITRVLHRREGDDMPSTGESDIGVFSLSGRVYLEELVRYDAEAESGAATHERNFLPFIPWLARDADVVTFPCTAPIEAVGINTPAELACVERWLATPRVGPTTSGSMPRT